MTKLRNSLQLALYDPTFPEGGGGPDPPDDPIPPVVDFAQPSSSTANGSPFAPLEFVLDRPPIVDPNGIPSAIVPFSQSSSTGAVRGVDYQIRTGSTAAAPVFLGASVQFGAQEQSRTLYYEALTNDAHTVTFQLEEGVIDPQTGALIALTRAVLGTQISHVVTQAQVIPTVPEVNFQLTTSSIPETDTSLNFVLITMTAADPLNDVLVNLQVTGTAVQGTHYNIFPAPPTPVTIPAGSNQRSIALQMVGTGDGTTLTKDETVVVELISVQTGGNAVLGTQLTHTATLIDTPPASTQLLVGFTPGPLELFEADFPAPPEATAQVFIVGGELAPDGIEVRFGYAPSTVNGAFEGTHFEYSPGAPQAEPVGPPIIIPPGSNGAPLRIQHPGVEDPDTVHNTGTFTLLSAQFVNSVPNTTVDVDATRQFKQLSVIDIGAPPDPDGIDGDLTDYNGNALPGLGARTTWDHDNGHILVRPAHVTVFHPEAIEGGDLDDLWQRAQTESPQTAPNNTQATWGPEYFNQNGRYDLKLAMQVAARIWEYENPAIPQIGQEGNLVTVRTSNIVSAETGAFASNIGAGQEIRLPCRFSGTNIQSVPVVRWFNSGNADDIEWDGDYTGTVGDGGPAGNRMIRDVVIYGFVDPETFGYGADNVFTDMTNMDFQEPPNATTDLFDNLIFARMLWQTNTSNVKAAVNMSKNHSGGFARGTFKLYDCQIRANPNAATSWGSGTYPRMWKWAMHLGSPAAWDFRTALTCPAMFGSETSEEHYIYFHGMAGPLDHPLLTGCNLVNIENVSLSNPSHGSPAFGDTSWRTFFQSANRRDDLQRNHPSNGQLNIVRLKSHNQGGGAGAAASAVTIWGHAGTVYTKDMVIDAPNSSWPGGGEPSGGIKFNHDYGTLVENDVVFIRETYPLEEGGVYTGTNYEGPMFSTFRWICDGYTFAVSPTKVKSACATVGVEVVKLVKFDFQAHSGLSELWRFNTTGSWYSQQKPGRMFTRQLDIDDLVFPDSHAQAGDAYTGDLSDYPGWAAVGSNYVSDAYHQNWNKVNSNILFVSNNAGGDEYIDNWPDVVDQQYQQSQPGRLGDMSEVIAAGSNINGANAWAAAGGQDTPDENTPRIYTVGEDPVVWMGTEVTEPTVDIAILMGIRTTNDPQQTGGSSFVTRRFNFTTSGGSAQENTHYEVTETSPIVVVQRWDMDERIINAGNSATRPVQGASVPGNDPYLTQNLVRYLDISGLEPAGGEDPISDFTSGTKSFTFTLASAEWLMPPDGSAGWQPLQLASPTEVDVNMIPYVDYPEIHIRAENGSFVHEIPVAEFVNGYSFAILRRQGSVDSLNLESECVTDLTINHGSYAGGLATSPVTAIWSPGSQSDTVIPLTLSNLDENNITFGPGDINNPNVPDVAYLQIVMTLNDPDTTFTRCKKIVTPIAGGWDHVTLRVLSSEPPPGGPRPGTHNTGLTGPLDNPDVTQDLIVNSGSPGQPTVIEDTHFDGAQILIQDPGAIPHDIIIRNCLIEIDVTTLGRAGIDATNNLGIASFLGCEQSVIIEDCEIFCSVAGPINYANVVGIIGSGMTVRRCYIHNVGIGVHVSTGVGVAADRDSVIADSYITQISGEGNVTSNGASHGNAIFIQEGGT